MSKVIWSVKPKITHEERRTLITRLPGLLAALNRWLNVIKWQDDARARFFAVRALRSAELADVPAMKIHDATVPPHQQHFALHDAAHFGPTAERLLLGGAIEVVERLHRVVVLRLLGLLVAGELAAIEDAPAMLRREPRVFQEDVRISAEAEAPRPSLVRVVQRQRLAAGGGHADREAGHRASNTSKRLPCEWRESR